MAAYEFFFAIDFSGPATSTVMLRELVSRVLGQAGCGGDAVLAVVEEVETAVARSAAAGESRCSAKFIAHDGRLEIVVSSSAGRLWHTTHPVG